MRKVLVINMGLKSIRCIIFDETGIKLGSDAVSINTAIDDCCVEQDPIEWCDKAIIVVRNALRKSHNPHIDYITVTTSASCLVCVDDNGKPLERAYMISDKRSEREAIELRNSSGFQDVMSSTGLDMSASLMLPKILWVKRHLPDVYDKSKFFLSPNDFLISLITGIYVTDELNASKYHYDCQKKEYPSEYLKSVGLDVHRFPEVYPMGTSVGTIKREFSDITGVNSDAQVVISSYDAICSFVGSGVTGIGEASDVSGTVTVFRTLGPNWAKPCSSVYSLPFIQEDKRIIGGSNNMGGGLIEWVKQWVSQDRDDHQNKF